MPPGQFDRARRWQSALFAEGFAGIDWPGDYGGQGLSAAHARAWAEQCAHAAVTPYMNFQGFVLAGPAIARFGTETQKQRFLRATLAAEVVWCQLFSEPDAGSDLVSLTTRAEADGDGWRVSGQKVWTSTAQLADHAILLARTDPHEHGHRGISFFLVDMTSQGITVKPVRQMTGDSEFCEVFLDGVRLGPDALLGQLGGGWAVATSVLADERSGASASGVALTRSMEELVGTPLRRAGREPSESDPVAQDAALHAYARAFSLGQLIDRSDQSRSLGPLTKLGRTEFETIRTTLLLHQQGPTAMVYTGEPAHDEILERFLYAPGMRLAGGTSEIQRNLIGERLLGLPREPRRPQ